MNKFVVLMLLASLGVSAAQQTAPQYAPVAIDGVSSKNGMVTIGGRTYVSLDALKAAGVNVLKSGSLGIYRYPVAQGHTVKLSGCLGEWLDNGRDRINVSRPVWDTAGENWHIPYLMQVPDGNTYAGNRFDINRVAVVFASGMVVQYAKNPLGSVEAGGAGAMAIGVNNPGVFVPRHPDITQNDAPVKIVLPMPQVDGRVISVDLTCKK